jgi:hypothetical protein
MSFDRMRTSLDWMSAATDALAKSQGRGMVDAFPLLRPTAVLLEYGARTLYEAHVEEILERVLLEEDTRPATRAEILAGLMLTGLKAPLKQSGLAVVEHLYGELVDRGWLEPRVEPKGFRETHEDQIDEDVAQARRRLADPTRTLDPQPKLRRKKR